MIKFMLGEKYLLYKKIYICFSGNLRRIKN